MTNSCFACAHFPESCNGTRGCKPKFDKPTTKGLEPCDHCGQQVYLKQIDGRWCIDDPTCERHHWEADVPCRYQGKEGLIEWWNTRYKRTCHFVNNRNNRGSWPDCSVCGEAIQRGNRFCGHCGAEVQDD